MRHITTHWFAAILSLIAVTSARGQFVEGMSPIALERSIWPGWAMAIPLSEIDLLSRNDLAALGLRGEVHSTTTTNELIAKESGEVFEQYKSTRRFDPRGNLIGSRLEAYSGSEPNKLTEVQVDTQLTNEYEGDRRTRQTAVSINHEGQVVNSWVFDLNGRIISKIVDHPYGRIQLTAKRTASGRCLSVLVHDSENPNRRKLITLDRHARITSIAECDLTSIMQMESSNLDIIVGQFVWADDGLSVQLSESSEDHFLDNITIELDLHGNLSSWTCPTLSMPGDKNPLVPARNIIEYDALGNWIAIETQLKDPVDPDAEWIPYCRYTRTIEYYDESSETSVKK